MWGTFGLHICTHNGLYISAQGRICTVVLGIDIGTDFDKISITKVATDTKPKTKSSNRYDAENESIYRYGADKQY